MPTKQGKTARVGRPKLRHPRRETYGICVSRAEKRILDELRQHKGSDWIRALVLDAAVAAAAERSARESRRLASLVRRLRAEQR